ncbi:hypothetical protein [Hymenobacter ruricola]|uniref:STAS/SEC14 domain-containing protein n=1 Tax=Hymenobacter ruricola TaxID=2791023 RepID=A0ABS0HXQ9_9BACT|nr:hypothetical protein [Hymenobacter ruricola]MBF9219476.1 hypothetical protein [Hymenobacter ruricola]
MQPRPASLPALDYLQYQFRPDLQVLVGRWLRQPTEAELHAGYQRLLEVAEACGARLWLVDARRRDHANQQGTAWMMEHFLPQLPQRLGRPVHMAYLFMPTHLYELEHDATVPPLTYFEGREYHVERFTEEQAAMQWLAACRAHEDLPA